MLILNFVEILVFELQVFVPFILENESYKCLMNLFNIDEV